MKLQLLLSGFAVTYLALAGSVLRNPSDNTVDGNLALSTNTTLLRRFWDDDVSSDADWAKYTSKGGTLMCGLEGTDLTAGHQLWDTRTPPSAASVWNGDLRQELREWYWHEMAPRSFGADFDGFWKFGATVRALGLSVGADNVCHKIVHYDPELRDPQGAKVPAIMQRYDHAGRSMQTTGAELEFVINMNGGAIYGNFLDSPKFAARKLWHNNKRDPEQDQLPSLRALSDIFWGYWNRGNPNIQNIRYFFMLGISNDKTNEIIARCLRNAGRELQEWPGVSFTTDSEEGHALLGSPNGATFAFFLMQHKAQLGHKTITRITVLRPETDDDNDFVDASLLFHVVNAPPPPADPTRKKRRKKSVEGDGEKVDHSHHFKI